MSLERVLQPLVACLGNPVAGNPTQFVMSRIARDAELDWRFFTSQVEEGQFETAFRGVQALGMAGAAILEPFQKRVLPLLDTITDAAKVMGKVTVARSDGQHWIGDHTLGLGILQLLQSRFAYIPPGEDPILEPQSIAVWGDVSIANAMQCSLASLDGDFSLFVCGDHRIDGEPMTESPSAPRIDVRSFDDMIQLERPLRALIVEDASAMLKTKRQRMAKILPKLAWASRPVCVFLHGRSTSGQLEIGEWLAGREVHVADEVELASHQAAVDFHFWTGYEPNLELIRESLEEYLQW